MGDEPDEGGKHPLDFPKGSTYIDLRQCVAFWLVMSPNKEKQHLLGFPKSAICIDCVNPFACADNMANLSKDIAAKLNVYCALETERRKIGKAKAED